jgi:hypothetical protein
VTAISSAEPTRRDFPCFATAAPVGAAGALTPLFGRMSPDASTVHLGCIALPPYQLTSDAKIRIGETSQA